MGVEREAERGAGTPSQSLRLIVTAGELQAQSWMEKKSFETSLP